MRTAAAGGARPQPQARRARRRRGAAATSKTETGVLRSPGGLDACNESHTWPEGGPGVVVGHKQKRGRRRPFFSPGARPPRLRGRSRPIGMRARRDNFRQGIKRGGGGDRSGPQTSDSWRYYSFRSLGAFDAFMRHQMATRPCQMADGELVVAALQPARPRARVILDSSKTHLLLHLLHASTPMRQSVPSRRATKTATKTTGSETRNHGPEQVREGFNSTLKPAACAR